MKRGASEARKFDEQEEDEEEEEVGTLLRSATFTLIRRGFFLGKTRRDRLRIERNLRRWKAARSLAGRPMYRR